MRTQRETLVQVNVLRKWGPQARLNYQRQRGLVLGYRSPTGTVGKGRLLALPQSLAHRLSARLSSRHAIAVDSHSARCAHLVGLTAVRPVGSLPLSAPLRPSSLHSPRGPRRRGCERAVREREVPAGEHLVCPPSHPSMHLAWLLGLFWVRSLSIPPALHAPAERPAAGV